MAKVKFGAVLSDTRGSVGGLTFSNSRAGAFIRSRVVPHPKQTPFTTALRSNLANLARRWFGQLDQTQRDAWIALAAVNPVTDVFGNSHVLTGQQFYIRVNQLRNQAGLGFVDDAPADQAVTGILTVTLSATAPGTLSVAFTDTPLDGTHRLYIYASPSLSPGRVASKPDMKFIGVSGLAEASPYDLAAQYTARFGNLIGTKQVSVLVAAFNDDTGALSPYLFSSDVA